MSYYILPKNVNNIVVNPTYSSETPPVYICHSLLYYYNLVKEQIINMFSDDIECSFECICKIANPYEFIFSKVPGSKYSVSKLKPKNNIFYDLLELINNLNLFGFDDASKSLRFLHFTPNYSTSIECFEMFRENNNDKHLVLENYDEVDNSKFDFLFCETKTNDHFVSLIQIITTILKNQKTNGTCIIKISDTFYKPTIDALYLLSSLYEKVYITKPNTNNVITFERYVICRTFTNIVDNIDDNCSRLNSFLNKVGSNNYINSLLNFNVPYYFKSKIEDINIIIGQQQLDSLNCIVSIYKNKNKNEKIETIKKHSIQTSVSWCEKHKIPYNKFSEKTNIFLPIINESI